MAIPLEPQTGFFPGLSEPPFMESRDVRDLVERVMGRWQEFEELRRAVDDGDVVIRYVFETKAFDPATDEQKRHAIAKVTKASPLWAVLAETTLVIQFRRWFWDRFDDRQREAVAYHELKHIDLTDGGDKGPRLRLRPHDLEEFHGVVRRYGDALPDIANLLKVHGWWRAEQPGGDLVQLSVLGDEPDEEDGDELGPVDAEAVLRMALTDPPSGDDPLYGVVGAGESLADAWARIEKLADFTRIVGSPAGQRLNELIIDGRGSEVPFPADEP
jgi:hypothetical protein